MGIPLLRGRSPSGTDTERSGGVVVIGDRLARRYWRNANPVGRESRL
jgi:hypothetical protein